MIWNWIKSLFRPSSVAEGSRSKELAPKMLEQLLDRMQISWRCEKLRHNDAQRRYYFQFQNGNFVVYLRQGEDVAYVYFLGFLDATFDKIDNVRFACNAFNQRRLVYRVSYSLNEEQHLLEMNLMACHRIVGASGDAQRALVEVLSDSFEAARIYREILKSICEMGRDDLEKHSAMNDRERFLARQAEFRVQHEDLQWRSHRNEHHRLAYLFDLFLGGTDYRFVYLKVVTDVLRSYSQAEEIADFDLTDLMIRKTEDGAMFIHESATLIVELRSEHGGEKRYLIQLTAEEENDDMLYTRVQVCTMENGYAPTASMQNDDEHSNLTFVTAYDTQPDSSKTQEFNYQWQELMDAIDSGKRLNEEQSFLAFCIWPNVGYNLYWGRRFFELRRYYDALAHLENAFLFLNNRYHEIGSKMRDNFYELAYFIGFCYNELGLYRQAYFYLDACYMQKSIRYTTEYVNCLVNGRDFRAAIVIDNLLNGIPNLGDFDEENEEERQKMQSLLRFRNFLLRRKAFVLIEKRALDEAELILQSLISETDSKDFALTELAHLQRLRQQSTSHADEAIADEPNGATERNEDTPRLNPNGETETADPIL